jgi:hypothetical protein
MTPAPTIDAVLITWGDRLFYPGSRVVKVKPQPKLKGGSARQRAAAIRERIAATVVRRAPQVMVKVTGGGRGMQAIAVHFRYISKNGRLDIEDERGETMRGREALHALTDDWRFGGTLIDDIPAPGQRREAFNLMLSMPRGTDPLIVQKAAREFAQTELADHKYVMVLHDHQANPHVHISVRAESRHGQRLNPRKADLHRWRETFAESCAVGGSPRKPPGRRRAGATGTRTRCGESRPGRKGGCAGARRAHRRARRRAPPGQTPSKPGCRSGGPWRFQAIRRTAAWRARSRHSSRRCQRRDSLQRRKGCPRLHRHRSRSTSIPVAEQRAAKSVLAGWCPCHAASGMPWHIHSTAV